MIEQKIKVHLQSKQVLWQALKCIIKTSGNDILSLTNFVMNTGAYIRMD